LKGGKADDTAKALEKVFPAGGYKASIDTRTNTLTVHGPRELLTKVKEIVEKTLDGKASFAPIVPAAVTPNTPVTALVEIGKTDAKVAIQVIEKAVGDVKIVDVRPDGIVLTGPSKSINEVRDLLKKMTAEGLTRTDEKVEIATIRLKHAKATAVEATITKAFDGNDAKLTIVSDAASNTLIVTGPPSKVADVKKLVEALDVVSGPAK
jgi:type II secretory pathway component GspD/PulD (secretin)